MEDCCVHRTMLHKEDCCAHRTTFHKRTGVLIKLRDWLFKTITVPPTNSRNVAEAGRWGGKGFLFH